MGLKPSSFITPFLLWNNINLPMYKGHYTTTPNIVLFANLACIENSLTSATCQIKNVCGNCQNRLNE